MADMDTIISRRRFGSIPACAPGSDFLAYCLKPACEVDDNAAYLNRRYSDSIDMNNQSLNKPRKRLISRWLTRLGVCLFLGALLWPSLVDLLPVDGLDFLVQPTTPRMFRMVPAEPDEGYFRVSLVGLGFLLICGGVLSKRKGR
jgi:hypothetical protein